MRKLAISGGKGSAPNPQGVAAGGGGGGGGGGTVSDLTLVGDESFTSGDLSSDMQTWHTRLWNGINSTTPVPDPVDHANSRNLYEYARPLNQHMTSLLMGLRATKDLALLDEVDALAELMRAQLGPDWVDENGDPVTPDDGTAGEGVRWVWTQGDPSGYADWGTDIHVMDSRFTHSLVAAFWYAFEVNRAKTSPGGISYANRADFWAGYLLNDFENIWQVRTGLTYDYLISGNGNVHGFAGEARRNHYFYLLTGDTSYRDLRDVILGDLHDETIKVGTGHPSATPARVWQHTMAETRGSTAGEFIQPTVYLGLEAASRADIVLDDVVSSIDATHMQQFANAFTQFTDDGDPDNTGTRFAETMGGEQDRTGEAPDGTTKTFTYNAGYRSRESTLRVAIRCTPLLGVWDDTGLMDTINDEIYNAEYGGDPANPDSVHIPAAKLLTLARNATGAAWVARATDPPDIQWWVHPGSGSDSNDGTTKANAWATFSHALSQVGGNSGTVVIGVVDGTYTDYVESNNYAAYVDGINRSAGARLWIRSETERGAVFEASASATGAIYLWQSSYVTVWGITGVGNGGTTNASRAIFENGQSDHCEWYRCLGADTAAEQYVYRNDQSTYTYYEECEGFEGSQERYRHVFSNHRSSQSMYRRCYSQRANAPAGTGFISYRSNDCIFDNCIDENGSRYLIYSENTSFDIGDTCYRSKLNGSIFMDGRMIQMDDRGSGTHEGFRMKDCLIMTMDSDGIRAMTNWGVFENCTIYDAGSDGGRSAISIERFDPEPANTRIDLINTAVLNAPQTSYHEEDNGDAPYSVARTFDYCNFFGGGGADSWDGGLTTQQNVLAPRQLSDAAIVANIATNSINSDPFSGQYGTAAGETLVWVPSGNVQKGAGKNGADIGCNILYRYESGFDSNGRPAIVLTSKPLWNPSTGEFPHGVEVAGVNDGSIRLGNVHDRLGVSGTTLPSGYGS